MHIGVFIALNAYIRQEKNQTNYLKFYLMKLENEEQIKSKSKQKKIIEEFSKIEKNKINQWNQKLVVWKD